MRHTCLHKDVTETCVQSTCESAVWICLYASVRILATYTNTDTLPCGMLVCLLASLALVSGVGLQKVFQAVTLAYLCLFYVTAPPSGEDDSPAEPEGMKPEIGRA